MDQLAATTRIDEFLVVTNRRFVKRFETWREAVSRRQPGLRLTVLDDGATDNGNRLGAVRDLAWTVTIRQLAGPVLVSAGDNLFEFDMIRFLDDHASRPRTLILTYREADRARLGRTGVAEIAAGGRLRRLWEKPRHPPSEWACPAFHILDREAVALLDRFLADAPDADAPGHFVAWLASRQPAFTHEMKGRRLEIGDLEAYRRAEAWMRMRSS